MSERSANPTGGADPARRNRLPDKPGPKQPGPKQPAPKPSSPKQSPPSQTPPSQTAPEQPAPNKPGSDPAIRSRVSERTAAGSSQRGRGLSAEQAGKPVTPGRGAEEEERPSGQLPMEERSVMATVAGVHPAIAFGGAAVLTAIGVAVDLTRAGTLGTVFTVCYITGCVLAVAWVRRSGVFWPMVAPPLLMVVAVPVVVLLAGTTKPGAGVAQRLLVIGAPLVNGFPMMAWTTGLVLVAGVFRLVTQRLRLSARSRARAEARVGGRTSASPRRS